MATKQKQATARKNLKDSYTVPGVDVAEGQKLAKQLQSCLHNLNDLHLTLKHAHWNVVGPKFIGVHKMLDPQVDAVREMTDTVAERMATMGVPPVGTPGALVRDRDWDDYSIGLAQASEHLGALDMVYSRVIENHRRVLDMAGDVDPITEDMLIGQTGEMEQYQWFVRAHLQDDEGTLSTASATTEKEAADQAMEGDRKID